MEVLPPRRASLPKKYIEELRVDTTGYLAGATMKEVKRPEGLYNVQVAIWAASLIEFFQTFHILIG